MIVLYSATAKAESLRPSGLKFIWNTDLEQLGEGYVLSSRSYNVEAWRGRGEQSRKPFQQRTASRCRMPELDSHSQQTVRLRHESSVDTKASSQGWGVTEYWHDLKALLRGGTRIHTNQLSTYTLRNRPARLPVPKWSAPCSHSVIPVHLCLFWDMILLCV